MTFADERFKELLKDGKLVYYQSEAIYKRKSGGIEFEIRYCPSLRAKNKATTTEPTETKGERRQNPFLPPEPELVLDSTILESKYILLFNKFCVVANHLLLITKQFVPQDTPLTEEDFLACLEVFNLTRKGQSNSSEWLFFYNSGIASGASQPHRHIQLVPSGNPPIFRDGIESDGVIPAFEGIVYKIVKLSDHQFSWNEAYQSCLKVLPNGASYNLIFNDRFMLLVGREKDSYQGLSFNALGFSGYLLVADRKELEILLDDAIELTSVLKTMAIKTRKEASPN